MRNSLGNKLQVGVSADVAPQFEFQQAPRKTPTFTFAEQPAAPRPTATSEPVISSTDLLKTTTLSLSNKVPRQLRFKHGVGRTRASSQLVRPPLHTILKHVANEKV